MGNLADVIEASMRSRSWKERHAKGVPVTKPSGIEAISWRNRSDDCFWYAIPKDKPCVWVGHEDIYGHWDITATFCNFRYKPEWLEKKGGKSA